MTKPAPVVIPETTAPTAPPALPGTPAPPAMTNPGVNLGRPIPATPAESAAGPTPGVAPAPRPIASPPLADDAPEPTTGTSLPPSDQFAQNHRPPVGAPAPVVVPPITAPVPPGSGRPPVPRVESYDEEMYRCKPGDTIASISRQFYHSEKYERALLQFNRSHPMAGEAVKQDPPHLQPGQMIHIPPLKVLESRYASVIPGLSPLPPMPQPKPNPNTNPNQNPPRPIGVAPMGEKKYRVRAGGERFYDIAQRTLGRGDRWGDVYRLNQSFNPNYPIPAGAVLRMPFEARIDAADLP